MNRFRRKLVDRNLRSLVKREDGVAAIEFALIAPVLVALVAVFVDFSVFMLRRAEMSAAINAAVRYYVSGGTDQNDAVQIAFQAWSSRPDDGMVVVIEDHFCGDAIVPAGTLCPPNNSASEVRPRIVATATIPGLFGDRDLDIQDSIRVR